MKFEKYIIGMDGKEYLLKCQVSGKLGHCELDPCRPDASTVVVPCLDNVTFCDLTVLNESSKVFESFDSLAMAPDYISDRTIEDIKEEGEAQLFEELQDL